MFQEVRKLPVYHEAKAFAVALDDFLEKLPRYRDYLKEQLRRAALSILLNLTEGATETEPREKARMYRLARRSAAERSTGLDFAAEVFSSTEAAARALDRRANDVATQIHHLINSHLRRAPRRLSPIKRKPRN